jgi:hypothetical protein
MSSRVLRKLQGESQLDLQHDGDDEEDEINPVASKGKKKKNVVANPFDLVSEKFCPR